MEELELDLTEKELLDLVDYLTNNFTKESKSYIIGDNIFEELGQAVFNEYIISLIQQETENVL